MSVYLVNWGLKVIDTCSERKKIPFSMSLSLSNYRSSSCGLLLSLKQHMYVQAPFLFLAIAFRFCVDECAVITTSSRIWNM